MIEELIQNYGYLFEEELLQEINQVGTFKEVQKDSSLSKLENILRVCLYW